MDRIQGDHWPGKYGKVKVITSCQTNVRELKKVDAMSGKCHGKVLYRQTV